MHENTSPNPNSDHDQPPKNKKTNHLHICGQKADGRKIYSSKLLPCLISCNIIIGCKQIAKDCWAEKKKGSLGNHWVKFS